MSGRLRSAVLVAVSVVASFAGVNAWPAGGQTVGAAAVGVAHAELVTVTDTAAAWSWVSVDDDGRPAVGPAGASMLTVTRDDRPGGPAWGGESARRVESSGETPYQYAEITGLWPGTVYRWRIEARGDGAAQEGVFVTFRRPAGRKLFSFAVVNDLHVGEEVSGLIGDNPEFPPGVRGFLGDPPKPYWEVMLAGAVEDINRRGVDFVVVNGDVTSGGTPGEVAAAKALLDRLATPYYVARGNHDRPHAADPFGEAFGRRGGGPMNYAFAFGGVRFIVLDLADPRTGIGRLTGETEDWLDGELAAAEREGQKAFVFLHHNVSTVWAVFGLPAATHALSAREAARLLRVVGRHRGVVAAIISGHSHRNRVTWTPALEAGGVPLVENAALKEYPGGYSIVTVYEGGWMRAFWRVRGSGGDGGAEREAGETSGAQPEKARLGAAPLEWVERTRQEFFGMWPAYAFGDLADRCGVYGWE